MFYVFFVCFFCIFCYLVVLRLFHTPSGKVFLWFSGVVVSGDSLNDLGQISQGNMQYFGQEVGACGIPDSEAPASSSEGTVFCCVFAERFC